MPLSLAGVELSLELVGVAEVEDRTDEAISGACRSAESAEVLAGGRRDRHQRSGVEESLIRHGLGWVTHHPPVYLRLANRSDHFCWGLRLGDAVPRRASCLLGARGKVGNGRRRANHRRPRYIGRRAAAYLGCSYLLAAAAVVICGRAGLFATGSWSPLFRLGSWILCGVFLLQHRQLHDHRILQDCARNPLRILGHAPLFASVSGAGSAGRNRGITWCDPTFAGANVGQPGHPNAKAPGSLEESGALFQS
jgi:hypothetical protein